MRILFRRKMSSKMIITSRILRIITVGGREWPSLPVAWAPHSLPDLSRGTNGGLGLTEGHPGLPQMQVHTEVCLKAEVHQGDVRAGFTTQSGVLHVAVKYTCTQESPRYSLLTTPPRQQSRYNHPDLTEGKTEARGAATVCSCQGLCICCLHFLVHSLPIRSSTSSCAECNLLTRTSRNPSPF